MPRRRVGLPMSKVATDAEHVRRIMVPVCRDLAYSGKNTNMICEHGLKLVKSARGKNCSAERVRYAGALAQLMLKHKSCGG